MSPLLRPILHASSRTGEGVEQSRPFPTGVPQVVVDGPDPDRVLLVGAGPASGHGAPDHESALPGTLARALAARTGRGAVVEACGAHRARVHDLPDLVRGTALQRFDAIVVCVGLEDATAGLAVRRWRRSLTAFVDDLRRSGARDATVVLVRIPPASSTGGSRGPLVRLADGRVRRLNRVAARLSRERDGVVVAAGTTPSADCPPGSPVFYERFAEELADVLQARFAGADR